MRKKYIIIVYFLVILLMINLFYKPTKLNAQQKKNLIFGAIKNYSWKTIELFFYSLKEINFESCDIVIFVQDLSNLTIEKIKYFGVKIYEVPFNYRLMKINNVRYKLYEEYLNNNLGKYNIVLCLDIRDSVFQKDFFELYKGNKRSFISAGLEEKNLTTRLMKKWMKYQYGYQVYQKIKKERIINSGTIWGTADIFLKLVREIWEEINSRSPYDMKIHDQTALNYIIYYKNMFNDCLNKNENNFGPVMTLALANPKNLIYDLEGYLLSYNGKKAALIHQYDRITKLVEIIQKRFLSQTNNSKLYYSNNKSIKDSEIKRNSIKLYILIAFLAINIIIIIIRLVVLRIIRKNTENKKNQFFKSLVIFKFDSGKRK